MKKLVGWVTAAGACILMTVLVVSAQDKRGTQDQKSKQKPETSAQPSRDLITPGLGQGDRQLATWLGSENESEIALGKFASERSQNEAVKKFAHQMIEDHTAFLNKLRSMTPVAESGRGKIERQPARADEKLADEVTKKPATRTDTAQTPNEFDSIRRSYLDPDGKIDLVQMKQEIARQCVESSKRELDTKSGPEFDKCFMGQQIVAHLQVADTIKVMKKYASPELRGVLDDGERTVAGHVERAKDLMKQLEGDGAKRPASKNDK